MFLYLLFLWSVFLIGSCCLIHVLYPLFYHLNGFPLPQMYTLSHIFNTMHPYLSVFPKFHRVQYTFPKVYLSASYLALKSQSSPFSTFHFSVCKVTLSVVYLTHTFMTVDPPPYSTFHASYSPLFLHFMHPTVPPYSTFHAPYNSSYCIQFTVTCIHIFFARF